MNTADAFFALDRWGDHAGLRVEPTGNRVNLSDMPEADKDEPDWKRTILKGGGMTFPVHMKELSPDLLCIRIYPYAHFVEDQCILEFTDGSHGTCSLPVELEDEEDIAAAISAAQMNAEPVELEIPVVIGAGDPDNYSAPVWAPSDGDGQAACHLWQLRM